MNQSLHQILAIDGAAFANYSGVLKDKVAGKPFSDFFWNTVQIAIPGAVITDLVRSMSEEEVRAAVARSNTPEERGAGRSHHRVVRREPRPRGQGWRVLRGLRHRTAHRPVQPLARDPPAPRRRA